ncbi:adenosylcobinamide-phosphate synthase CbiB [Synechocystis sp. LKSZ1]|uniref:adenosylcobinamide-phosphate synthase CbiB n=1 Tax=Synechocystis sp. LKSZ1 TaxID=3144951 RepID=UPI00336BCC5F
MIPAHWSSLGVLVAAAGLDYWLADPQAWLHPVQVIGWGIQGLSQLFLRWFRRPSPRRLAGIVLAVTIIGGTGGLAWIALWGLDQFSPALALLLQIIGLASCFAGRSLALAAEDVLSALALGNLELARQRLSYFVGRDTEHLTETEILRATLESIAENTVDGATAPLFYAILGAGLPGVGPLPLTLAYKAASTLDSMVGYRREPYTDLGWCSARLEDYLTWFPCRLTVLTLALWSGRPRQVLALCCRDAPQDPSPNSGWSECVYAAILNIQLGGVNTYQGIPKEKPLLGDPVNLPSAEKVRQALYLSRTCLLLWLSFATLARLLLAY